MAFSATLTPPSGLSLPTKLAGASGTVYVPGSTSVTVSNERDMQALVSQGWGVSSYTAG